jgi:hypothetical protein
LATGLAHPVRRRFDVPDGIRRNLAPSVADRGACALGWPAPTVRGVFDEDHVAIGYAVHGPVTCNATVIPGKDVASGRTCRAAERLIARVRDQGLRLEGMPDTHVHADQISAAPYIREIQGGRLAINLEIVAVQLRSGGILQSATGSERARSDFDRLIEDCDTLTDSPGGAARSFNRSIRRLLRLARRARLFVYRNCEAPGRRCSKVHAREGIDEDPFPGARPERISPLRCRASSSRCFGSAGGLIVRAIAAGTRGCRSIPPKCLAV